MVTYSTSAWSSWAKEERFAEALFLVGLEVLPECCRVRLA